MKSATRLLSDFVIVYVWIAVVATLVKVLTPVWRESSWYEVLVILPAGGTVVWQLHRFLVRKIKAWMVRRRGES